MAIARTWASVLEDEQQLVLGETMVRVSTLQPMLDASWSRAAPVPRLPGRRGTDAWSRPPVWQNCIAGLVSDYVTRQ